METATVTLNSGHKMPMLGLGSFDGFNLSAEDLAAFRAAIQTALAAGYKSLDCAEVYGNEHMLGEGLEEYMKAHPDFKRSDLFITSKVFNNHHSRNDVKAAAEKTLKDLKIDYLDLYLIHWPVPTKQVDGKFVPADIPLIETWRAMEELVEEGKVRSIGVSNFQKRHLEQILSECKIKPAVNQVECHPLLNQAKLLEFCKSHGIVLEAYSPLGKSGARYVSGHQIPDVLGNPVIKKIAEKHGASPAQVALKWQIQRGIVVIPKSVTPERIQANLNIGKLVLDSEDMDAIFAVNTSSRIVCPPFMTFADEF